MVKWLEGGGEVAAKWWSGGEVKWRRRGEVVVKKWGGGEVAARWCVVAKC
jgi:hypothetical protein